MNYEECSAKYAWADRLILYRPAYTKLTGNVCAGILLSHIYYWITQVTDFNAFAISDIKFAEEAGLSINEFRSAKKKLKKLNFLQMNKQGNLDTTTYNLDITVLANEIKGRKDE